VSVKIAINPITWTNDDVPELGGDTPLEQCLSEIRQAGYAGTELGGKYPREIQSQKLRHGACQSSGQGDLLMTSPARRNEHPISMRLAEMSRQEDPVFGWPGDPDRGCFRCGGGPAKFWLRRGGRATRWHDSGVASIPPIRR